MSSSGTVYRHLFSPIINGKTTPIGRAFSSTSSSSSLRWKVNVTTTTSSSLNCYPIHLSQCFFSSSKFSTFFPNDNSPSPSPSPSASPSSSRPPLPSPVPRSAQQQKEFERMESEHRKAHGITLVDQLQQTLDKGQLQITGFSPKVIQINQKIHFNSSLILFPTASFLWKISTLEELTPEKLAIFTVFRPEISKSLSSLPSPSPSLHLHLHLHLHSPISLFFSPYSLILLFFSFSDILLIGFDSDTMKQRNQLSPEIRKKMRESGISIELMGLVNYCFHSSPLRLLPLVPVRFFFFFFLFFLHLFFHQLTF
jgi:uncharacterized protein